MTRTIMNEYMWPRDSKRSNNDGEIFWQFFYRLATGYSGSQPRICHEFMYKEEVLKPEEKIGF